MNLKEVLRGMMPRVKPPVPDERSTYDQMKEVIDLAEEFDKLQVMPIWEKILRRMGADVNSELLEAARFKYEPVRQTTHTVRWDAKRELLDDVLAWIEATQRERDRIIQDFKELRSGA